MTKKEKWQAHGAIRISGKIFYGDQKDQLTRNREPTVGQRQ